jgi:AcrR family transcriptional regulator
MRETGTSAVASSEVIAVAAGIIKERGIASFTVEQVAAELGCEPRDVRYWFISEADILAALMTLRQERFVAAMQERNARATSHAARMCMLFDLCVEDYDATLWIELWKLSLREPVAREARQRINDRYSEMVTRMIRSGQAAGEFGDTPAAQTATAMAALIVGLAVQATLRDPVVSPEYMRETLVAAAGRLLGTKLR